MKRRRWKRYICTVGVMIVTVYTNGCSGGEPTSRQPVVRDSMGIRIVENHDDAVPKWQLSSVPTVDIGSATDPLTSLFRVEGAHRLSDGRIVIANRGSNELRFYGADGEFLHAAGREGEGPGEYVFIAWSARCGSDTLYVYDIGTQRMTVLDEHGEMLRSSRLMLPDNTLPYGSVVSCQSGGPIVSGGWPSILPETGVHRPPMPIGLAALDGTPMRMIGTFPGVDRWGMMADGSFSGSRPMPLGRDLLHAVTGDRVFVGTGDAYEVAVYGLDGTLQLLIRLDIVPRPITAADIDAYTDAAVAAAERPEWRATERDILREVEFPTHLPPYAAFVVDANGALWIQDYPVPGAAEVTWRRFDSDGLYNGTITMPATLRVFEIGADYVVGHWQDELDVEHVRMLALTPPSEAATEE